MACTTSDQQPTPAPKPAYTGGGTQAQAGSLVAFTRLRRQSFLTRGLVHGAYPPLWILSIHEGWDPLISLTAREDVRADGRDCCIPALASARSTGQGPERGGLLGGNSYFPGDGENANCKRRMQGQGHLGPISWTWEGSKGLTGRRSTKTHPGPSTPSHVRPHSLPQHQHAHGAALVALKVREESGDPSDGGWINAEFLHDFTKTVVEPEGSSGLFLSSALSALPELIYLQSWDLCNKTQPDGHVQPQAHCPPRHPRELPPATSGEAEAVPALGRLHVTWSRALVPTGLLVGRAPYWSVSPSYRWEKSLPRPQLPHSLPTFQRRCYPLSRALSHIATYHPWPYIPTRSIYL